MKCLLFNIKIGVLLFSLCLVSCSVWEGYGGEDDIPDQIDGLVPVYLNIDNRVEQLPTRQIIKSVGLVVYKDFIFVQDEFVGLHVIDNRDSTRPEGLSFIRIPGVKSFTINNQYLYVNQVGDLITIAIHDINNIKVESIQTDVFQYEDVDLPLGYSGYFECPDSRKGKIASWESRSISKPECLNR